MDFLCSVAGKNASLGIPQRRGEEEQSTTKKQTPVSSSCCCFTSSPVLAAKCEKVTWFNALRDFPAHASFTKFAFNFLPHFLSLFHFLHDRRSKPSCNFLILQRRESERERQREKRKTTNQQEASSSSSSKQSR